MTSGEEMMFRTCGMSEQNAILMNNQVLQNTTFHLGTYVVELGMQIPNCIHLLGIAYLGIWCWLLLHDDGVSVVIDVVFGGPGGRLGGCVQCQERQQTGDDDDNDWRPQLHSRVITFLFVILANPLLRANLFLLSPSSSCSWELSIFDFQSWINLFGL